MTVRRSARSWFLAKVAVTLVAVSLVALTLCLVAGGAATATVDARVLSAIPPGSPHVNARDAATRIDQLARHLRERPTDATGWITFANALAGLGRYAEAVPAYAAAAALLPRDAGLLADYAGAVANAQGLSLDGTPSGLIERALAIDPGEPKVLALAGAAAYRRGEFASAVDRWQRALWQLEPQSNLARALAAGIAEAQHQVATATGPAQWRAARGAYESALARRGISGVVRIAPALVGRVEAGDTLFVYAHAADGDARPLAILRKPAHELPAAFFLDDSTTINMARPPSAQNELVIGARVSRRGSPAGPARGDLQGFSAPVRYGQAGVVIVIDSEVK